MVTKEITRRGTRATEHFFQILSTGLRVGKGDIAGMMGNSYITAGIHMISSARLTQVQMVWLRLFLDDLWSESNKDVERCGPTELRCCWRGGLGLQNDCDTFETVSPSSLTTGTGLELHLDYSLSSGLEDTHTEKELLAGLVLWCHCAT